MSCCFPGWRCWCERAYQFFCTKKGKIFPERYGSQRSFPAFPMFSRSCSLIRIVTTLGSTPSVFTSVFVNSFTTVRFCSVENPFRILIIITGMGTPSARYCWIPKYLGSRENRQIYVRTPSASAVGICQQKREFHGLL